MAFTPFTEADRPEMQAWNQKFLECIAEAGERAPKVVTGSYVGTGTYGSSNPCIVKLDFTPEIFFIMPESGFGGGSTGSSAYFGYMQRGGTWAFCFAIHNETAMDASKATNYVDISNNQVYWWSPNNAAGTQMNVSGRKYNYLAIGL